MSDAWQFRVGPGPRSQTQRKELAARLTAQGVLTVKEIAAQTGGSEHAIYRWRKDEKFRARVQQLVDQFAAEALNEGLSARWRRIKALGDRHHDMMQVIRERSTAERIAGVPMAAIPGASTGLVTVQVKAIGSGANQKIVPEYVVDVPLLVELRKTEEQIAKELGQLVEKREHSGANGGPIALKVDGAVALVDSMLEMIETSKTEEDGSGDSAGRSADADSGDRDAPAP